MTKAMDITGQRFGKLTVSHRVENHKNGGAQWFCRCDCGGETIATVSILRSGNKVSCGCAYRYDLIGKKFGMLTVTKRLGAVIGKSVLWLCECECGKTANCTTGNLMNGSSQSCGCVRTKHNGKGTRLYRIWSGVKDRCLNPKSKYRKRYGGRGITVCKEWADDFSVFKEWAESNGYAAGLEIDRKDNDGNYCPENCRWITPRENSRNKSTSKLSPAKVMGIRFYIEKTDLPLVEIGRRYGIASATVSNIKQGVIWNDIR